MLNLNHVHQLAKYHAAPLAVAPGHAARMLDLGALLSSAGAGAFRASRATTRSSRDRSGRETIKLHGIAEGGYPGLYTMLGLGFATTDIERQLMLAREDRSVTDIVLSFNTPGGSIEGIPELAAAIRAAAQVKPVTAMVAYQACSAGYWLASQCDRIICAPSAEVGSIGVYTAHRDESGALAKAGVKNTFVSAGKYKVEARTDAPLSASARDYMQEQVDRVYARFITDVAMGRNVSRAVVMKNYGQGRVLSAADAKKSGMVDAIAASVDAVPTSAAMARKTIAALLH